MIIGFFDLFGGLVFMDAGVDDPFGCFCDELRVVLVGVNNDPASGKSLFQFGTLRATPIQHSKLAYR